jgi:hypothetical protein
MVAQENSKEDSEAQPSPSEETTKGEAGQPTPLPFAEFLEGIGPSQSVIVSGLWRRTTVPPAGAEVEVIQVPELLLHCTSDMCNGPRFFRYSSGDTKFRGLLGNKNATDTLRTFITYLCSNCRTRAKTFSLSVLRTAGEFGTAYKFGEQPPFGPPTSERLIKLFGKERDTFLKGRESEIHGLGVGAFTYYRRVVESHKDQIFDEII